MPVWSPSLKLGAGKKTKSSQWNRRQSRGLWHMPLMENEGDGRISRAEADTSLLSRPSHRDGISNAPAAAHGSAGGPETGERRAARWTFKTFPANGKSAGVEITQRMRHKIKYLWLFSSKEYPDILGNRRDRFHLSAFREDLGRGYF